MAAPERYGWPLARAHSLLDTLIYARDDASAVVLQTAGYRSVMLPRIQRASWQRRREHSVSAPSPGASLPAVQPAAHPPALARVPSRRLAVGARLSTPAARSRWRAHLPARPP